MIISLFSSFSDKIVVIISGYFISDNMLNINYSSQINFPFLTASKLMIKELVNKRASSKKKAVNNKNNDNEDNEDNNDN